MKSLQLPYFLLIPAPDVPGTAELVGIVSYNCFTIYSQEEDPEATQSMSNGCLNCPLYKMQDLLHPTTDYMPCTGILRVN